MLESYTIQLATLSAIILTSIYVYFKLSFTYWKKRGIPYLEPKVPFGNFGNVIFSKENPNEAITKLYKAFDGEKVGGVYRVTTPTLLLRDPEIIKDILVKDFDHFYSRGLKPNVKVDPLQGHLFALSGSKWRNLRVKLTPTFTSGKMKMMFGTLVECGQELQVCLQKSADMSEVIEIKDVLSRYSTDIIASCAFGIQCNCLKNPDAEFRTWGRKIFTPNFKTRLFRILAFNMPRLASLLRLSFIPKNVGLYFRKMVKDTVEYREKNDIKRNDFLQLLIQLKNKTLGIAEGENEEVAKLGNIAEGLKSNTPFEITLDVMAAQAFVFFLAGFETSSTTMTFCMYELATNPQIQEKVREEIDRVLEKNAGNLTYESLFEMDYLDKVVNETLRKYPPVTNITRECTKPVKLRGTDVTVEKGTPVLLPIKGIHHDPKYYPDPEKFDPERFSEDEKKKRPHFTFLPFGEGPRICIGMRFGVAQTKVGIISLLSNFEVQASEKTPIPLVYDPKSLVLAPLGGMWLKIVNRSDKR